MKQSLNYFVICMLPAIIFNWSCSKSSTSSQITTTPPCTEDICKLTSHTWRMIGQTVYTDKGNFKYTQAQTADMEWASFLFNPDSTYINHNGNAGLYTYTASTKTLVLMEGILPLQFNVTNLTQVYLSIVGNKTQMNPQTDTSASANFAIDEIAGGLHNDFGVDTSTIHYIQTEFDFEQ
jgi:hypothetical protein